MIDKLIEQIEGELARLGYNGKSINELPDVIIRIEITIRLARLYYYERHALRESDEHWCADYSYYVHWFDRDEYQRLYNLYQKLINKMKKDSCFSNKPIK